MPSFSQLLRLLQGRRGLVVPVKFLECEAPLLVELGITGFPADGLVHVREGLLVLAHMEPARTAAAVVDGLVGGEDGETDAPGPASRCTFRLAFTSPVFWATASIRSRSLKTEHLHGKGKRETGTDGDTQTPAASAANRKKGNTPGSRSGAGKARRGQRPGIWGRVAVAMRYAQGISSRHPFSLPRPNG